MFEIGDYLKIKGYAEYVFLIVKIENDIHWFIHPHSAEMYILSNSLTFDIYEK